MKTGLPPDSAKSGENRRADLTENERSAVLNSEKVSSVKASAGQKTGLSKKIIRIRIKDFQKEQKAKEKGEVLPDSTGKAAEADSGTTEMPVAGLNPGLKAKEKGGVLPDSTGKAAEADSGTTEMPVAGLNPGLKVKEKGEAHPDSTGKVAEADSGTTEMPVAGLNPGLKVKEKGEVPPDSTGKVAEVDSGTTEMPVAGLNPGQGLKEKKVPGAGQKEQTAWASRRQTNSSNSEGETADLKPEKPLIMT